MTINQLKQKFKEIFEDSGDCQIYFAPARVNLIGEHIDYNGGYVFPAALTQKTVLLARAGSGDRIRLCAGNLSFERFDTTLTELEEHRGNHWYSYLLGVFDEMKNDGLSVGGCDLLLWGNVPAGAGLSSSASVEVAAAVALYDLFTGGKPDMTRLSVLCQRAENHFVGVSCGIMDQFASANGKKGHALMLNCSTLAYSLIPLDLNGYRIVIANTNKKRALADSKYNERRAECDAAFAVLSAYCPKARALCDIKPAQFEEYKNKIEQINVRNRAEHAIYENQRVLQSAEALKKGDIELFGALMTASHSSLRDLYEVTGKELDAMTEEALKLPGVAGSRMTGAGFGGCTVSIVREDAVERFLKEVPEKYQKRTGLVPQLYVSDAGDGAGIYRGPDEI